MITPAGKECTFFYGDYFRGRENEECRLLEPAGLEWTPVLCNTCPMPEIFQANGCENMRFSPEIKKPLFFMKPQVIISTSCVKCECEVEEPEIGCGLCHPDLSFTLLDPIEPAEDS